jgi:hypothetical protein
MTAIWHNDGSRWSLLAPTCFPDEAALHDLVEKAPETLPLAGAPRLIILGREVSLGNGSADLVGIEPTGRIAVIEVKLARNAEIRRAVVAQVLSYAAHLHGLDRTELEQQVLSRHLRERGHQSLEAAVEASDQEGAFDSEVFDRGLRDSLAQGRFRLVLIVDDAPPELVRLVSYLETVTADKLLIDLIAMSSYSVGGSQILVPQRVEAERQPAEPGQLPPPPKRKPWSTPGADDFEAAIEDSPADQHPVFHQLTDWAKALQREGLATLRSTHGISGRLTLAPCVPGDNARLVTIWNDQYPSITLAGTAIRRLAPQSLPQIEAIVGSAAMNGKTLRPPIADDLLQVLTTAYREATKTSRS